MYITNTIDISYYSWTFLWCLFYIKIVKKKMLTAKLFYFILLLIYTHNIKIILLPPHKFMVNKSTWHTHTHNIFKNLILKFLIHFKMIILCFIKFRKWHPITNCLQIVFYIKKYFKSFLHLSLPYQILYRNNTFTLNKLCNQNNIGRT